MLMSRLVALALALSLVPGVAAGCEARDFLAHPLPAATGRSAAAVALETAYPGLVVDEAAGTVTVSGAVLPLGDDPGRPPRARLADPSILESFAQPYPLTFDLAARAQPWFDPGRARHEGLLRALYGGDEAEVARHQARVDYRGDGTTARFAVSSRQCVAAQLQAALDAIAAETPPLDAYFADVGGSFNWRRIAGTDRLSAHSFGVAVDFNTRLGGYWRWTGATEGAVGAYDNRYPRALVKHMERHGFVWGGKWHHFDGMHFEYRPELILHARLTRGAGRP